MENRGILIAFEGVDGAGKTTQVTNLEAYLKSIGEDVIRSKEPTDGPWGQKIRNSAQMGRLPVNEELHAFVEDRKEHIANIVGPALKAGKIVILDRYFYSTIAYQGVRGADVHEISRDMISQFPVPDLVFLIDVPAEVGISRVREGRGETPNQFEMLDKLRASREAFLSLAATHKNITEVNGCEPIETVRAKILSTLLEGILKARYCAKSYGCDDVLLCGPRLNNECQWVDAMKAR